MLCNRCLPFFAFVSKANKGRRKIKAEPHIGKRGAQLLSPIKYFFNERRLRMQSNPHKLTVIDGETLMDKRLLPTKFCVDTLLPQGLCILGGSPKVGKSWLVLDLCVHVAQGTPLCGLDVTRGRRALPLPGRQREADPGAPEHHHGQCSRRDVFRYGMHLN